MSIQNWSDVINIDELIENERETMKLLPLLFFFPTSTFSFFSYSNSLLSVRNEDEGLISMTDCLRQISSSWSIFLLDFLFLSPLTLPTLFLRKLIEEALKKSTKMMRPIEILEALENLHRVLQNNQESVSLVLVRYKPFDV